MTMKTMAISMPMKQSEKKNCVATKNAEKKG
jgi:hypothetical protein